MVNSNTAICITIISVDIQSIVHNIFLQDFNMGRATVCIDICTIRLLIT